MCSLNIFVCRSFVVQLLSKLKVSSDLHTIQCILIKFVYIYKLGAISKSLKNDKIMYFTQFQQRLLIWRTALFACYCNAAFSLCSWSLCLRSNFMLIGHVLFGSPLHLNMSITLTMIYKVDQ